MTSKTKKTSSNETDGAYLLKIVMYAIFGSLWLKFSSPLLIGPFVLNGLPVGLFIGLLFASHDHFQVDRKVEYAVLIIVAVMSYFLPSGILL